jgi:hypothetical protein
MHKKKHDQFNKIDINSRQGLRVGGVVIPAVPGYWGYGIGGTMSMSSDAAHEASESPSQEAAENATGGSEGASMASGSGEAAGTSAGAGAAGGM